MNWPWNELGLSGPASLTEVRRAYAQRLQEVHPEENPEDFQRLHDAYQEARRAAKKATQQAETSVGSPSGAEEPVPQAQAPAPQEEVPPPQEETAQANWDYDALLEEGDREEATRRAAAPTEEEIWTAVDQALNLLYQFWRDQYPRELWHRFFYSRLFFQVKGDPDFLVGLEEFILEHPDLDIEILREIWNVYGCGQRHIPALYRPLQRCLTGEQRELAKKGAKKKRKTAPLLVLLAVVLVIGSVGLRKLHHQRQYAELAHWIEEDFQRPIRDKRVYTEPYLYVPDDEPDLHFSAWRSGERDLSAGTYGYETDFPSAMLKRALSRLERTRAEYYVLENGPRPGDPDADSSAIPVYQLETRHADVPALLAALDQTLNKLETTEAGYALFPPDYTVILSHRGLTWYSWTAPEERFDLAAAQEAYDSLPFLALSYDVRILGLLEEDFGGAEVELSPGGFWEEEAQHFPKRYLVLHAQPTVGGPGRWYILESPLPYLYDLPEECFSPHTALRDLKELRHAATEDRSISSQREMMNLITTLYRG